MSGDLHIIIPAGGAGTRLWPLSRRSHPKFLLDLTGSGRSLLQATVDRLAPQAASMTIVTGAAHRHAVLDQLPDFAGGDPHELIIEPSGRESMPALGVAAYIVRERYGDDALVASFAADHVIACQDLLMQAVDRAAAAAREGFITTIGIAPVQPSTASGYIRPGEALKSVPGVRVVDAFVEKPDAHSAQRYVGQGYVWNAGMFVMKVGVLAGHLARLHPQLHQGLECIARAWDTPEQEAVLAQVWPTLDRIAIDHAVAEPVANEGGVAVALADPALGWTDVGDFAALEELRPGANGAVLVDSSASVYSTTGHQVAVVGVDGVIVVVTQDAVLVTRSEAAQDVKKAVDALAQAGEERYL